jgi:bile acid:Na+ symporter, BASS family
MHLELYLKASIGMILFLLMLSLGAETKLKDIEYGFKNKRALLITLFSQYVILPGLAFLCASFFGFSEGIFVALLLLACCPGGLMSNALTFAFRGNALLSVSLTSITTLLSFVMTPLLLKAYTSLSSDHLSYAIPHSKIFYALLALLVPFFLGFSLKGKFPEFFNRMKKLFSLLLLGAIILLFLTWSEQVWSLWTQGAGRVLGAVVMMAFSAMLVSFVLSLFLGEPKENAIAVSFETGIQNSVLAFAILNISFPGGEDILLQNSVIIAYGLLSVGVGLFLGFLFRSKLLDAHKN